MTDRDKVDFSTNLMVSAAASAIAAFLTSPLDMGKLLLQIHSKSESLSQSDNSNSHKLISNSSNRALKFFSILRSTYKEKGIRGLFRGAVARVLNDTITSIHNFLNN